MPVPARVAVGGGRRAEVPPGVAEGDPGAAFGAEALGDVRFTVAGGVPQGEHTAWATLQRDEQIAVRPHREVPRRAHLVRDDDRAEARGERDPTVVGIAGG